MKVIQKILLCFVAVISVSGVARAAEIIVLEVDESQRAARAAQIVVFEAPVDEFQTVNAKFDVDSKLGRAWVDVENVDSEFQTSRTVVNRKVDGLSYDSEAKEVLYRLGDGAIVCAEANSFLGMTTLRPTGNCPLTVSYEERTVDDGFRPSTQNFAKVTLNPKLAPTQTSQR